MSACGTSPRRGKPRSWRPLSALVLLLASAAAPPTRADEEQILAAVRAFFETKDLDRRRQLAEQIESDPAYQREKVGGWLHRAAPFDEMAVGVTQIRVPLRNGQTRGVVLRIPARYDPRASWPLIYALHGTGGRGEGIITYLQGVLADAVDEYIIAAPSGYGEAQIHDVWPPPMEHPTVLAAVKRKVHVDSGRVFIAGYSRGGHAAWMLAVLHADQFAGALPLAGTLVLPEVDRLWEPFLDNVANTHVLCVWGANDAFGEDRKTPSPHGGIAGLNRKLGALAARMDLPVIMLEDPDKGHADIVPPAEMLADLLSRRRTRYPRQVKHTFRHIYQAQVYWIEGHKWTGSQWTDKLPQIRLREGENVHNPEHVKDALLRTMRGCLGELHGRIDGQLIDVRRKKVKELTVWIGDGMIDWREPVMLKVSGRKVFEGRLEPDLFVCLSQAARTWDFDRLRWVGLRFKSGSKLRVVTGRTEFPPPGGGQ